MHQTIIKFADKYVLIPEPHKRKRPGPVPITAPLAAAVATAATTHAMKSTGREKDSETVAMTSESNLKIFKSLFS